MGPERDERSEFKEEKITRVKIAAKKAIQKYYESPLHYLFYGTLGLTIVLLFIGIRLQWQLYCILCTLGAIKLFQFYKKNGT